MSIYSFKNSQICSPDADTQLSDVWQQRAFMYADGCFETMRVSHGVIPLLPYHIERVLRTVKALKIPLSEAQLKQDIAYCLDQINHKNNQGHQQWIYKIIIGRGGQGRGAYPQVDECVAADLYSLIRPYTPVLRPNCELVVIKDRLPTEQAFSGGKLINRLAYSVAVEGQIFGNDQEALFLNEDGNLVETMHHNLFFIKDKTLYTPSLKGFGVKGVMRAYVIKNLALQFDLTVSEGRFKLDELIHSEGACISNAVEGLVEVRCVGEHVLEQSTQIRQLCAQVQTVWVK